MSSDPVNQVSPVSPPGQSLVTELELGSARGNHVRVKQPLEFELIRALTVDDLPSITNPPPVSADQQLVSKLRHSHHRLAELIASGRPQQEISLITGYSPSYISSLQGDPAFRELVAYYEFQVKTIFIDSMERLKLLGLDAMEKLHERVNDPAVTWSNEELRKLVDMAAVQPGIAKNAPAGFNPNPSGTNNVTLEVKFVGANPSPAGPQIEATYTEVKIPNAK